MHPWNALDYTLVDLVVSFPLFLHETLLPGTHRIRRVARPANLLAARSNALLPSNSSNP